MTDSKLTFKTYTFANTDTEFRVGYNEKEEPVTFTSNLGGEPMVIGTSTRLDLNLQPQVCTGIADELRFKAYDNPLNALSGEHYLLVKTNVDLEDGLAIAGNRGHINAKLERSAIVSLQEKGIHFGARYWPLDPERFDKGWGVIGQDAGMYYIQRANNTLRQARKMNVVRGLKMGREVTAYVATCRPFFAKILEGCLETDDDLAWQRRNEARRAAQERAAINRRARNDLRVEEGTTVTVAGNGKDATLVDTSEGWDQPQTIVANLEMRKYGTKRATVNLATLPEGDYTIFSADAGPGKGGHIVYSAKHWSPVLTPFTARQWANMIEAGLQIEVV